MATIQYLIMGGTYNTILLFFVCGVVSYFADYKIIRSQSKSKFRREAKISKIGSCILIFGSILASLTLLILDWVF